MNDSTFQIGWVSFLVGVILGCLLSPVSCDRLKSDAIKAGVACYEVDPETGKVTFKWIEAAKLNQEEKP